MDDLSSDAPPAPSRLRHWLNAAGIAVTLAALAFVAFAIQRSFSQLSADLTSPAFLAVVAGGGFAYALLLVLLGFAWRGLLVAVDGPTLGLGRTLRIYARTQVYKYLPGNIFHMLGRYAEARRAGASHAALGIAQILELGLLSAAGGVVGAILALPLLLDQLRLHGFEAWLLPIIVIACSAVATGLSAIVARRLQVRRLAGRFVARGLAAFALYMLFMVGSGALAWGLALALGGPAAASPQVIGITAAAWLVGFLVPGAPGGLGVRDAVLIAGLTAAGIPGATAIALGHRIITALGDALLALAGFAIRRR